MAARLASFIGSSVVALPMFSMLLPSPRIVRVHVVLESILHEGPEVRNMQHKRQTRLTHLLIPQNRPTMDVKNDERTSSYAAYVPLDM